jgi:SAM-dependent methyltransferase
MKAVLPFRICPSCGAADEIVGDQPVWPSDWCCSRCARAIEQYDGIPLFAPELADTISGVNPAMFDRLAQYEETNFWFVPRNRLIASLLTRYFATAESIMEVGCGSGFVLSAIAETKTWRHLVGSELHPSGLIIARARLGRHAELVQLDARMIPAREAFDVIGAFDVLEHIEDDAAALAAMHQAVRVGGGIMLAVPQHPWLWSQADEEALHVRRYRRGELERKVEAAGFRVLFSASYTALLLPLMAASRSRKPAKSASAYREFELPRIVNRTLKAMLQLEVTLTLSGIHFPAGGSRVIVAAKAHTAS